MKLEDKITIDSKGNLYVIVSNKNLPDVKTVWKFDTTTKIVLPYIKVNNADLKFISYWAAQNKLVIQDDSKIYTLGLNEQKDELVFLIGRPNSSSSQLKDGVDTNASAALNFPVSYFDDAFYILEKNRFLRKVSLSNNEASVKTISIFETGAYAYLTMRSKNTFFIDRKKT
ncbi:hypothetical protein [Myroides odoratus]|uniref:hypothetical protein n=1 Tax=Myroides odoratus TaxID=256 RepID=UPI0039AF3A67